MVAANPYQQYKEQSLSALSPGEILVKLYDELIKQMRISVLGLEKKDYGPYTDALIKSQAIIATLESSLDTSYEIAVNLRDLYIFIAQQLTLSNVNKDSKPIEDCIPLVRDMRDSFDQADKITRKMQHVSVGGKAV